MARTRRTVQILLLSDDDDLGEVGDVVAVKPGYARNFLIPSGHACRVTPDALRRVEKSKEQARKARRRRAAQVAEQAKALESFSLTLEERASEEGHLFGSVSESTIVEALKAEGVMVQEKQVVLDGHIKELGIYNVPVRLDPDHTVEIRVWVVEPTE